MHPLKLSILFLAAFILASIPVALGLTSQLDRGVTTFLQTNLGQQLDTPLSLFSLLGSFEVTTLILVAAIIRTGLKKSLPILAIFALGMVIELVGKSFLYHPSPPGNILRYNLDIFLPSGSVSTGHSYPSGHSYRSAFLAVFMSQLVIDSKKISLQTKKYLPPALYTILLIMLISRISLGEHWATDVFGGALLGLSFSHFALGVGQWQEKRKSGKISTG